MIKTLLLGSITRIYKSLKRAKKGFLGGFRGIRGISPKRA